MQCCTAARLWRCTAAVLHCKWNTENINPKCQCPTVQRAAIDTSKVAANCIHVLLRLYNRWWSRTNSAARPRACKTEEATACGNRPQKPDGARGARRLHCVAPFNDGERTWFRMLLCSHGCAVARPHGPNMCKARRTRRAPVCATAETNARLHGCKPRPSSAGI